MVLGRRPSKTRGFLRFSIRPRDPLRTLGWSTFKNSWFFAIFKLPARPSADFGLSALENSWFFAIFKSLARPFAEFRVVESLPLWRGAHFLEAANLKPLPSQWDALQGASWRELENVAEPLELLLKCFSFFENSWFFFRFSIRPRDPLRSLGWLTFENSWFFAIFKSPVRPSAEFCKVESLSLWRGAHFDEAARPKPVAKPVGFAPTQTSCELETIAKPLGLLLKRRRTLAISLSIQKLYFRSFFRPNPRSCG